MLVLRDIFHFRLRSKQINLLAAIEKDDISKMEGILSEGLNPNRVLALPVKEHRVPPLFFAALTGKKDAAALLLRYGADANYADDNGYTARDRAVEFGHSEVANMLAKAELAQSNGKGPQPPQPK
ncbi:ankyrin repeat domain-containing protein [Methyloligella solikamskensis]|uniref:Ankyrin repeat domain-containing protein n=1 Tax=Methyloligella solikamskensis TaxID=1177756 RepID=A0ABW3J7Y7_9HYPH